MHIESVHNRKSHPTILLRESYRADGKVKKRTIANLTHWPEQLVEGLRTLLRGGVALETADQALTISRSLPHGHVATGVGTTGSRPAELLTERLGGRRRDARATWFWLIVSRVMRARQAGDSSSAQSRPPPRAWATGSGSRSRSPGSMGARLAARPTGADRERAGEAPSHGRHAGAL